MVNATAPYLETGRALQIVLAFNPTMSRRGESSSGSTCHSYESASNRRRIDIENLLNPSEEDSRTAPRQQAQAIPLTQSTSTYHRHGDGVGVSNSGRPDHRWRQPYGARRSPPRTSGARREFRPTYSEEETLFIWYHRIDLGLDWGEITRLYNRQFPDRNRDGLGGIQCKYYRCCQDNNIPKVRERSRSASVVEDYGMRARTGLFYPWMRR